MIMIFGALVENDESLDIFLYFQNFVILGCCEVKVPKMSQNGKKFSLLHFISGTINHMIVIYGTLVQSDDILGIFSFFQSLDFSGY